MFYTDMLLIGMLEWLVVKGGEKGSNIILSYTDMLLRVEHITAT